MSEVRVTDPRTGGQKGAKPERFSMLPPKALGTVARVYGYGAEKYERDNWRKGYAWSLSYDALHRHLAAFWSGEDIDPESGLPHLAHAAFHVLTLLTFSEEFPEGDDRYRRPEPEDEDEDDPPATGVRLPRPVRDHFPDLVEEIQGVATTLPHVSTIEHRHDAGME